MNCRAMLSAILIHVVRNRTGVRQYSVDICFTIFQWQEYDKVNKVQPHSSFYLL